MDTALDRRTRTRAYDELLPDLHPVKLSGSFIFVDFVAGGRLDGGVDLDTRVSPRKVLAWLRSMPSYRAGVPLCIGHGADPGPAFDKVATLIGLVDPGRSVVYLSRRPFTDRERAFFAVRRHNLLLELQVTPRSAALGVGADPLDLVRSAAGLDPHALHWVVGPIAADGLDDARRILEALPRGSRLTLRAAGGASAGAVAAGAESLARLEEVAHAWGHTVSEWSCRSGVARVGRGFFDVGRLTGQRDLVRRAHDLITCSGCPSRTQCHGPLDEAALLARLPQELQVLGLDQTAAPVRTGPRAFRLEVAQPVARGDEVYLSHALGPPVAVTLACRGRGAADGGGPGGVEPAVLRRWYRTGFLPVTELNSAAGLVLEDLRRFAGRPDPQAA